MKQFGITSNIMSLSGIAIAIGVLVDAAIVMTENVIRHCERAEEEKADKVGRGVLTAPGDALGKSGALRTARSTGLTAAETWQVVLDASKQVGRPIFFAMAIIILAFVPVFAPTGQEARLFPPLAFE